MSRILCPIQRTLPTKGQSSDNQCQPVPTTDNQVPSSATAKGEFRRLKARPPGGESGLFAVAAFQWMENALTNHLPIKLVWYLNDRMNPQGVTPASALVFYASTRGSSPRSTNLNVAGKYTSPLVSQQTSERKRRGEQTKGGREQKRKQEQACVNRSACTVVRARTALRSRKVIPVALSMKPATAQC